MNAIQKFCESHKNIIFALSTSLLISYLAFRTKKTSSNKNNQLSVSLKQLIKDSSTQNITKIVIANCPSSKGNFRRQLISQLKQKLTQEKFKVLINCTPQKLMMAGSQCFLESMQQNDGQYCEYYYNLLKNQFLIEDTISKIQLINQPNQQIVMICDNSPIDIKILNESDNLWHQFLQKYHLQQKQIFNSYALVFHIIEEDSVKQEDKRIQESCKFLKYVSVKATNKEDCRNKFQQVFQTITQHLSPNQSSQPFNKEIIDNE